MINRPPDEVLLNPQFRIHLDVSELAAIIEGLEYISPEWSKAIDVHELKYRLSMLSSIARESINASRSNTQSPGSLDGPMKGL